MATNRSVSETVCFRLQLRGRRPNRLRVSLLSPVQFFRNVAKLINLVILNVILNRQNPLDSKITNVIVCGAASRTEV
jgi:hypothetical protein